MGVRRSNMRRTGGTIIQLPLIASSPNGWRRVEVTLKQIDKSWSKAKTKMSKSIWPDGQRVRLSTELPNVYHHKAMTATPVLLEPSTTRLSWRVRRRQTNKRCYTRKTGRDSILGTQATSRRKISRRDYQPRVDNSRRKPRGEVLNFDEETGEVSIRSQKRPNGHARREDF